MNPIVKLFAKHHVAAYFIEKFSNPETRVISCDGRNAFSQLILSGLTSHFVNRVDAIPHNMREIKIQLSNKYKNLYMDEHKAFDVAAVLEFWFWKDAGIEVLNSIYQCGNMQVGINEFYEKYGLSDEIYDRDNFRRQLQRNQVFCPKGIYDVEEPDKRLKTPKITPALAVSLTRLYESGKFTYRDLANRFKVDHTTIMRTVKKVQRKKVQKSA